MKYKQYTKNTPEVSEIGLGAWQLGVNSGWKGMSEKEAVDLVHQAVDKGVNFIDTAPVYGLGTSEERLGKALMDYDRSRMVINSKFGRNEKGEEDWRAESIQKTIEGSLRRLKTDYLDSVIIHNPPFEYLDGHKNDHYDILERLKEEGKILDYGASLDTYEEIKLLIETTGSKVIMAFFNILHQDAARAFELAKENQVGIIVKIPLDSGWLTGKYNQNSKFNDVRSRWSENDIKTRAGLVDKIKEIIGEERNLAKTAISFCLAYDAVSTVIPGNTSLEQLDSNLDSLNHPLSSELLQKLEQFYTNDVKRLRLPW